MALTPQEMLAEARGHEAAGRWSEAEGCWQALVEHCPGQPEPSYWLAGFLMNRGRLAEALAAAETAFALAPASDPIRFRRGQLLFGQRRFEACRSVLEPLLARFPGEPDLLRMLANSAIALGKPALAVGWIRPHLQGNSGHAGVVLAYALACSQIGATEEAETWFQQAIRLDPGSLGVYAGFLLNRGDPEGARRVYEQLLEGSPLMASVGLAQVDERLGRRQEAHERFRSLLPRLKEDPNIAVGLAATARTEEELAQARTVLDQALELYPLPIERRLLLLRRGDVRHRQKEWAGAWGDWAQAHTQEQAHFDPAALHRQVDALIGAFQDFPTMPQARPSGPAPIFILGVPRSGTSLVEQILASHPMVFGGGERADLQQQVDDWRQQGFRWPEEAATLGVPVLEAAAEAIQQKRMAIAPPGVRAVTDKKPDNFMRLGLIAQLFPHARIIHCRRHPLDTAVSCFQQAWPHGLCWSRNPEWFGLYYLEYRRLMAAWHRLLPVPILDLDYELLVRAPTQVIPLLTEFCGLPWDSRCLEPHRNSRVVVTASYDQVRHPIRDTSVGRWRNFREQLLPLQEMLARNGVPV